MPIRGADGGLVSLSGKPRPRIFHPKKPPHHHARGRLSSLIARPSCPETVTLTCLLMVAWGWIMVTLGMVFFRGYYFRRSFVQPYLPGLERPDRPDFQPGHGSLAGDDAKHHYQQKGHHHHSSKTAARRTDDSPQAAVVDHRPSSFQESPLLIFTCHRAEYLQATLRDVLEYIPRDCRIGCPVVVSQDGTDPQVAGVIQDFARQFRDIGIPLVHLTHPQATAASNGNPRSVRGASGTKNFGPYQALAQHYGWALRQVFDGNARANEEHSDGTSNDHNSPPPPMPRRVIILEEDLHIAPDFFDYFFALQDLLDRDTSLLAVSAYNDNGFQDKVSDATRVMRSDFFPGLGWMMTERLWSRELATKWPEAYWDDWLREPRNRQGRHILRPEVSRTFHFGTHGGASSNQFGDKLRRIWLNPTAVDWPNEDLTYLSAETFDRAYWRTITHAKKYSQLKEALRYIETSDAVWEYQSWSEFQNAARILEIMDDEKAGVPRTAYKGVVELRPRANHILFLTPPRGKLQQDFAHVL